MKLFLITTASGRRWLNNIERTHEHLDEQFESDAPHSIEEIEFQIRSDGDALSLVGLKLAAVPRKPKPETPGETANRVWFAVANDTLLEAFDRTARAVLDKHWTSRLTDDAIDRIYSERIRQSCSRAPVDYDSIRKAARGE